MSRDQPIDELLARIHSGGHPRYHEKNASQHKLFARERIARLVDPESFCEDGAFACAGDPELAADAVITGTANIQGRAVAVMANDSTVKAGSWGRLTVEKILRIQETAERLRVPMLYLVDSAGARITDQVEMFPGRRGAGRIFKNEVRLSGWVPQVCLLFGPSAAGGAYIPAFCDVVAMVEGNASMYLGSPRMAEVVIGEKVTLEQMGGAKMHCSVSGCGDVLCSTEDHAIEFCKRYLGYMPQSADEMPRGAMVREPAPAARRLDEIIPTDENKAFDMGEVLAHIIDEDSFLEIKSQYAREIITGFARIRGSVVGIVANQPKWLGGVLFVDSADKAARFISLCDAFRIPLVFLADVPGFMIGSKVERQGIIRAGAKMIAAVSEATVPKVSVIVRKAYGAGLYAMCGPAFDPEACLALPGASIAVMGPEAAVNAVYYNKLQELEPGPVRQGRIAELRADYRADIDLVKLASAMVVDAIVPGDRLRHEISVRLERAAVAPRSSSGKKHSVMPM